MITVNLVLILVPVLLSVSDATDVQVKTTLGRITGKIVHLNQGFEAEEFTGVPFAEPAVGDLRFKKPVAKKPWNTTLNATGEPKLCAPLAWTDQSNDMISEDCLYLNIWVPTKAKNSSKPFAVMAFIHGVEIFGSTRQLKALYNGSILAGYNNVIVVEIEYRQGPLGFAYFNNISDASGNLGLWDQVEALKWIHDNIVSFGGNSSEVTIFGHGTGAVFASYHLFSPASRNYFSRMILESGSALVDWSLKTKSEAVKVSEMLFEMLAPDNCPEIPFNSGWEAKVTCLRSIRDLTQFTSAGLALLEDFGFDLVFSPILDGEFFPSHPRTLIKNGKFARVPLLLGVTKDEGSQLMTGSPEALQMLPNFTNPNNRLDKLTIENFELLTKKSSFSMFPKSPQMTNSLLLDTILMQYYPFPKDGYDKPQGDQIVKAALDAVGDYAFTCPTIMLPTLLLESPAYSELPLFYVYYFSHRRRGTIAPKWMGSMHGAELPFVFGEPFRQYASIRGYSHDDKTLSKIIMAYWSNFAKNGNPNGHKHEKIFSEQGWPIQLRKWPEFQGSECPNQIVELNLLTSVFIYGKGTHCGLKAKECRFWTHLFPKLVSAILLE